MTHTDTTGAPVQYLRHEEPDEAATLHVGEIAVIHMTVDTTAMIIVTKSPDIEIMNIMVEIGTGTNTQAGANATP